jgi:serine protease Do
MLVGVNSLHRPLRLFAAIGAAAFALVGAIAHAGPLPPLPGPNAPIPPQAVAPGPVAQPAPGVVNPAAPMNVVERTRRGIVTVERDGRLLGVGTVLNGDGRIITSLGALGASDVADVRYADGSVVKAKVGHRDRAWDLALLVPQTGKWMDGLSASEADPGAVELKTFIARAPKLVAAVPLALKARSDVRAKDGDALPGALELDLKGFPMPTGAPIIDGNGNVVAVFVNACKAIAPAVAAPAPAPPDYNAPAPGAPAVAPAAAPCTPMIVGAPIPQVRRFLSHTPPTAVQPPPWLGIRGESDNTEKFAGVRVLAVANDSPAAKGGLKANLDRTKSDLIIAVDGQPVDSPAHLGEAIGRHSVGDTVKLLVWNGEKLRDVAVQLRSAP